MFFRMIWLGIPVILFGHAKLLLTLSHSECISTFLTISEPLIPGTNKSGFIVILCFEPFSLIVINFNRIMREIVTLWCWHTIDHSMSIFFILAYSSRWEGMMLWWCMMILMIMFEPGKWWCGVSMLGELWSICQLFIFTKSILKSHVSHF